MEKKASVGVKALGWAIIVSNLASIYFDYFFLYSNHTRWSLYIMNFISSVSIFPRGLPWLCASLSFNSIGYLIWPWRVITIFCGIGILKLNNFPRIMLIILSSLHIPTFVLSQVLMSLYVPFSLTLHGLLIDFSILWFPLMYIVFFTRPKVKDQFKRIRASR